MLTQLFSRFREKIGFAPRPDLNSKNALLSFAERQSAYVSQVTLYGYVKTRAGTSWPKLFENETYLISLKTARWHIYAACVADISQFLAARLFTHGGLKEAQAAAFANEMTAHILKNTIQEDVPQSAFDDVILSSSIAAEKQDWHEAATKVSTFQSSADAFMRWAPTADEFKVLDEEIMRNSIHMRWIGIRRDVKETLDAAPIIAELTQ